VRVSSITGVFYGDGNDVFLNYAFGISTRGCEFFSPGERTPPAEVSVPKYPAEVSVPKYPAEVSVPKFLDEVAGRSSRPKRPAKFSLEPPGRKLSRLFVKENGRVTVL
jgi:hypothetical protein